MLAFVGFEDELPGFQKNLDPLTDQVEERWKPVIRPMDTARNSPDLDQFLQLFNRSLEGMWGFVPLAQRKCSISSVRCVI